MDDDQVASSNDGSDASARNQTPRRSSSRGRRNMDGDGGGGISLKGVITFFSVGSVILLLLIIGYLLAARYGVFSSRSGSPSDDGAQGGTIQDSKREEFQNKVGDDVTISSGGESPLSSSTKREDLKNKLKRLVREMKNQNAFRDQDTEQLNALRDNALTVINFVESVHTGASQETLKQMEEKAKTAMKRASSIRETFLNQYSSKQQPEVTKKLERLSIDVIWTLEDEMDTILKKNQQ